MISALKLALKLLAVGLMALYVWVAWDWFIEPAFGLDRPDWSLVLGVLLILSMLRGVSAATWRFIREMDDQEELEFAMAQVFVPTFVFGLVALVYWLFV